MLPRVGDWWWRSSYYPTASDPNTCKTGGLGVVDPMTLAWRYYVKLNPNEINKAMWAEVSPDGRVWTSSGTDLLAYSAADVSAANAGPTATPLSASKRMVGLLRASSVSGATFWGDRLYLAYDRGSYIRCSPTPSTRSLATSARRGGWRSSAPSPPRCTRPRA
jgi:hypothetical protein